MKVRLIGLLVLAAALVLVAAAPAGAWQPSVVMVSGRETENDAGTPGDPSDDYADLSGVLVGELHVTSEDWGYDPLTGTVIAWGTEHFEGCLDRDRNRACGAGDPSGTLDFALVFWGQLNPTTYALLAGQCVHAIRRSTGDFEGAQGAIRTTYTPRSDGSVVATYLGVLRLFGTAALWRAGDHSTGAVAKSNHGGASAPRHVAEP